MVPYVHRVGPIGMAVVLFVLLSPGPSLSAPGGSPVVSTPYAPVIDTAAFGGSIDNPYFPLQPGTTYIYAGEKDGQPQHEELTVTGRTKMILGVRCVTVHDQVTASGKLVEDTMDWYAQDTAGNVWYFGEATRAYENGKVTSTEGSWQAGVRDAKPGIIMPATPRAGDIYQQEYLAGEAEDMAQVLRLHDSVTVPYGTSDRVLVTKEWSPLEPGVVGEKFYAPGIGLVKEASVKGEDERFELVEIHPPAGGTPVATPAG